MLTLGLKKLMSVPTMFKVPMNLLFSTGLPFAENTWYQCTPQELIKQSLQRSEGVLNEEGDFVMKKESHRPSSVRIYFVKNKITGKIVEWHGRKYFIEPDYFESLYKKMIDHLGKKEIWIRDNIFAAAEKKLNIRSINENAAGNLFIQKMFLEPSKKELANFNPDWYIIHSPEFFANPATGGIRTRKFVIADFANKIILAGGSDFTDQIKGSIFSILEQGC
jgi:phosphoenolpyruvate carboxykinase (ATP)